MALALFGRVIQLATDQDALIRLPNMYYNLQIYACFGLPILFCLGFSINTLVWTRSHINYKFIFEFDPRDNLDYHEFAEVMCMNTYTIYICTNSFMISYRL